MRYRLLALTLAGLVPTLAGCAAGFRTGGDRGGVGAGAAVGPVATYPPPPAAVPR